MAAAMSGWTSNLGGNRISNGARSVTISLGASRLVGSFASDRRGKRSKLSAQSREPWTRKTGWIPARSSIYPHSKSEEYPIQKSFWSLAYE